MQVRVMVTRRGNPSAGHVYDQADFVIDEYTLEENYAYFEDETKRVLANENGEPIIRHGFVDLNIPDSVMDELLDGTRRIIMTDYTVTRNV